MNSCRVMGIVNVYAGRSFADGGRFPGPRRRPLSHARKLIADGADVLDIGGESTRPGAQPVTATEEMARTVPLITAVRAESDILISIDTMKPEVARAAVQAESATMWNDVSALTWSPDSAGGRRTWASNT